MSIVALLLVVIQALLLLRKAFGGSFVAMRVDELSGRPRFDPTVEPEQEASGWSGEDWLATTTILAFDPKAFGDLRKP